MKGGVTHACRMGTRRGARRTWSVRRSAAPIGAMGTRQANAAEAPLFSGLLRCRPTAGAVPLQIQHDELIPRRLDRLNHLAGNRRV